MHGNDQTMRRVAKLLAWTFGAVACVMTASAGAGLGGDDSRAALTLGVGFAAVSVGTAVLPYFIDVYWRCGSRAAAGSLMAILAIFGVAEYGAHVMYTVGHRSADTNKATHQDVVYDGAQDSAAEAKTQLALFTARLEKLTAANPWAAATTPDSINADIASMEGNRIFKRSKQCSAVTIEESRAFCDRYAAAKSQLGIIEEMNRLPNQIEATLKVVADARGKLASSQQGSSDALMQSTLAANLATQTLKPTAEAIQWAGISIGSFVALLFAIAAPAFVFMAYRSDGNAGQVTPTKSASSAKARPVAYQPQAQPIGKLRMLKGFVLPTAPGAGMMWNEVNVRETA
jgi:hypothetical protein